MNLLSLFRRKTDAAVPPASDDAVARARTRARRRLVGAIVLVAIGVIALPLMFDGEPRPLPPDIPIEIPRKDGLAPLALPSATPGGPAASAPPPTAVTRSTDAAKPAAPAPAESASPDARVALPKPGDSSSSAAAGAASPVEPKPPVAPAPKPAAVAEAAKPPATADAAKPASREAERARPAAETRPAAADGPRFVVQVGAFADPASARDAVERVQKLGLKPFTQTVQTEAGARTRVRIGPFATREEAQRVQARTEAAGIKSAVMPQ